MHALQAHNGSGKTTCFVLAMLGRVDESVQRTQALCICPTRELVVQNLEVLQKMGRHTQIRATSTARADSEVPRSVRSEGSEGSTFAFLLQKATVSLLCHLQGPEDNRASCDWHSWEAKELA